MTIAYTMAPGRGDTDLLLGRLAGRLLDRGCHVCGTVQINTECDSDGPCDMDVRVLPDGPVIRISQSLGKCARGCRLDPAALETAVALVEASLGRAADLLIINKFGKHEADGRGFRGVIGEALAQDIPVLVGLNRLNEDRFREFAAGMAEEVPATLEDLERWVADHVPAIARAQVSA